MTETSRPEHWFSRIEQIYHEALERREDERLAFLTRACAGDDALHREVEKLLCFDSTAGSFLESPALDVAAQALARKAETGRKIDLTGQTILHYEVLEKIGEGGMGVVYKALDTNLQRPVAIKVLPPGTVADRERRLRFVQEARAASALNHPNIVHVYSIDQARGTDFIAMEYVTGKTLAELIPRKGMKLNDALKYSIQIADALAAAHAVGIVHRDLKPANVMITETGLVKALDFGVAKLTECAEPDVPAATETLEPRTEEGTILGTAAYMSPEQAEGKKVDARSDIFSLGSVLYEMVTGQKAFQRTSKVATLSAILLQEPAPISEITPTIPPELERLINRCLRKDPVKRFQRMADVRAALEELKGDTDSGRLKVPPARAKQFAPVRFVAVVFAAAVLVAAGWYWMSQQRSAKPEGPLTTLPLTSYPGDENYPCFSPDGTRVAFQWCTEGAAANCDIYIKQVGVEPPYRLTTDPAEDFSPAWSPDGQTIAFLRRLDDRRASLILIPQRGGPERVLGDYETLRSYPPGFLAWTPDSKWLVVHRTEAGAPSAGLSLLNVETGEARRLTTTEGDNAPAFSPDGRTLAFCRVTGRNLVCLLRLTKDYQPEGEAKHLVAAADSYEDFGIAWSPGGKEIVFSSGYSVKAGLWRVAASAGAMPRRLALAPEDAVAPAVSRKGNRLAYVVNRSDANIWRIDLAGPGQKPGIPARLIASTREEMYPSYSPDGRRIAFVSDRSGSPEIWACASDGSNPVQLTALGGPAVEHARWSPDGQNIVFSSAPDGNEDLYAVSANGGPPRRLTTHPRTDVWPFWSRDGHSIYFRSFRGGSCQVWKMPASGGEAVQITRNGGDVPEESPDGRFVYYERGWPSHCSVWRVPAAGGEEVQVLDATHPHAGWTVGKQGIYFFTAPDRQGKSDLCLYRFATGKVSRILTIERSVSCRIAVSPDGRTILYSQLDQVGSDLMLVQNFR